MSSSELSPLASTTTWSDAKKLAVKHQHLLKYLVIGGTASAIDVLLFLLFYNVIGVPAIVAHSISVPASVIFSFVFNARHNFRTTDHVALRLFSFVVVAAVGYLVGLGVIELCRIQGIGANAGKILSLPIVFIVQYLLNSRITFRKTTTLAPTTENIRP